MAENLGIAGSGAIACGLARAAASSHDVLLWARSEASADRACAKLEDSARVVTDLSELAPCGVVVEAVASGVPAGVPGAYRLLANLIALNKKKGF